MPSTKEEEVGSITKFYPAFIFSQCLGSIDGFPIGDSSTFYNNGSSCGGTPRQEQYFGLILCIKEMVIKHRFRWIKSKLPSSSIYCDIDME